MSSAAPETPEGSENTPPLDERRRRILEVVQRTVHNSGNAGHPQVSSIDTSVTERRERIRALHPALLVVDHQQREASPHILEQERVYTSNLVPNDVLRMFDQGRHYDFRRHVTRGGMFNRYVPTHSELHHYGVDTYESVRDQNINDVLGISNRPGTYHVQGLFDQDENLRTYLSFRLPPHRDRCASETEYEQQLSHYQEYLKNVLLKNSSMHYQPVWDKKRLEKKFPEMWELDTLNVEKGWGGSGMVIMRETLRSINALMHGLPDAVYCYRYLGLKEKPDDESPAPPAVIGPNRASGTFFEDLGFVHMAKKDDPEEQVYREFENGEVHPYSPVWEYLYCSMRKLQENLEAGLKSKGLMQEGERLL